MLKDAATQEDLRPKYASKLREFALMVESQNAQPAGCMIQLYFRNQPTVCLQKTEDDFPAVEALGILQRVSLELNLSLNSRPLDVNSLPPPPDIL